jgi:hypothetical protein
MLPLLPPLLLATQLQPLALRKVRNAAFLRRLYIKMLILTKTGSGQT